MEQLDLVAQSMAANAIMGKYSIERERALGGSEATYFDGKRAIYDVAGYPKSLDVQKYLARYRRDGLARRIVRAAPNDTWRKPFKMLDGVTPEDAVDNTEFVKAWNRLLQSNIIEDEYLLDDTRRNLWYYFYEADRKAGIGRYSVMVLGFADGQNLEQPLKRGAGRKLIYIDVHDESCAKIMPTDLVTDTTSPRFGLPEYYQIDYGDGLGSIRVHRTRVIHVAEGGVLYGEPRLESPYNTLVNIEKITAASAEGAWQSIARKIIIKSRDGYRLSEGTVMGDKVEEMINGFKNFLELEGADSEVVTGEITDPSGSFDTQVNVLCAGTEIPKRRLFGAEAGQLASGQETDQWNDVIRSRRVFFVEPAIIFPFAKRMVYAGVLPPPSSGGCIAQWESLDEPDDTTQAQTFETYTRGLSQLSGDGIEKVVKPRELVKFFVRGLPANAVPTEDEVLQLEQQALDRQQQQMEMMAAQKEVAQPDKPGGNTDKPPAKGKPEPAVNSYSEDEQQAIFEAAVRVLANA